MTHLAYINANDNQVKILTVFSINTKNTFESYLSHTFVVAVVFGFACEGAELNQLTF